MDDHRKTTELSRLTVIEDGSEISGTMNSTCPVMVRGKLDGEVEAPAITVAPGGCLSGHVSVGTLLCHGEVGGEIDATEASLAGRVNDGSVVRAKSLEVKLTAEGAMTVRFGAVRLEVGEAPVPPKP